VYILFQMLLPLDFYLIRIAFNNGYLFFLIEIFLDLIHHSIDEARISFYLMMTLDIPIVKQMLKSIVDTCATLIISSVESHQVILI